METFEHHLLFQLHLSYLQARKNKYNTHNQLAFEMNRETELYHLARDISNRTYIPKPCIAFIIQKPVMREIFEADFSDRVIHHLLYRCIYPIIEDNLIQGNYSCIVNKDNLFDIKKDDHFMRSCSQNYTQTAYDIKLGIEAYFMNMDHNILYDKVSAMLPAEQDRFLGIRRETILYLLQKTIVNDVTLSCYKKDSKKNEEDFPASKSLLNYTVNTEQTTSKLSSQVFGNVYLSDFYQFIKEQLKLKYYGGV